MTNTNNGKRIRTKTKAVVTLYMRFNPNLTKKILT